MNRTDYHAHKQRGDHRAFLWLSREHHVVPIKDELREHFERTGIHIPMQVKLREIVDDYCRALEARKRKPAKVKRRNIAA